MGVALEMIKLHFYHGTGLIGRLIRRFTWGEYAHVAIEVDGWTYEALEGKGVIKHKSTRNPDLTLRAPDIVKAKLLEYLESKVGLKYDWWGIYSFIARKKRQDANKLFCSEYAASAFEYAQMPLLERVEAWKISPSMLSCTPLLHE